MSITSLYFTAPGHTELRERESSPVRPETVKVETEFSAISSGTEKLLYRGDAPASLETDGPVETLIEDLSFPTRYGYAATGRVVECGCDVDNEWLDRRVFAYNPHESAFVTEPESLLEVPGSISMRRATLLATMETAVNFVLDAQPTIGERVTVFGQGTVGLVTTALLSQMPLESLTVVEPLESRRNVALQLGAEYAVDPETDALEEQITQRTGRPDLTIELSGNPDALNDAMEVTGFDGRVIVGSWYGTEPASLSFGERFHRHRLSIESSQVSTIAPQHEGRWSRERRHGVAWDWLADLPLDRLVTHEFPFKDAPKAYELLADSPEEAIQVLLSYD